MKMEDVKEYIDKFDLELGGADPKSKIIVMGEEDYNELSIDVFNMRCSVIGRESDHPPLSTIYGFEIHVLKKGDVHIIDEKISARESFFEQPMPGAYQGMDGTDKGSYQIANEWKATSKINVTTNLTAMPKFKIFSGRNLNLIEERVNGFLSSHSIDFNSLKITTNFIEKKDLTGKSLSILYTVAIFYLSQEFANETKD